MYFTLVSGIRIFYREAGNPENPVILLLHGFPTSSNQFRNLIPILSKSHYVIAPDLPGFGFTEVPQSLDYQYSFDALSKTIYEFLSALHLTTIFSMYIFDFGAPVGLRMALEHPDLIQSIVSQNGNAYEEGLSSYWDTLKLFWKPGGEEYYQKIRAKALTYENFKSQYVDGEPDTDCVDPVAYTLDWALMQQPGRMDHMMSLFRDYGSNVEMYPQFQEFFRRTQIPILAIWGKNDIRFPPEGALAFKKDLKSVKVELIDAGHFAVESHTKTIGESILAFLGQVKSV